MKKLFFPAALLLGAAAVTAAEIQTGKVRFPDGTDGLSITTDRLKAVVSSKSGVLSSLQYQGRELLRNFDRMEGGDLIRANGLVAGSHVFIGKALHKISCVKEKDACVVTTELTAPLDRSVYPAGGTVLLKKEYTFRPGEDRIRCRLSYSNPNAFPLQILPWIKTLFNSGKRQAHPAVITETGLFDRYCWSKDPKYAATHHKKNLDQFYLFSNYMSLTTLSSEPSPVTFAWVLAPEDTFRVYLWQKETENYQTIESIMTPRTLEAGRTITITMYELLAPQMPELLYASPALLMNVTEGARNLGPAKKTLTLQVAVPAPLKGISGKIVLKDAATGAKQHTVPFRLPDMVPGKLYPVPFPVQLEEKHNYLMTVAFSQNGKPFRPGELAGDLLDPLLPLVTSTMDNEVPFFPLRAAKFSFPVRKGVTVSADELRTQGENGYKLHSFPAGSRFFREDKVQSSGRKVPLSLYAGRGENVNAQILLTVPAKTALKLEKSLFSPEKGDKKAALFDSVNRFLYVQTHEPSSHNISFGLAAYPEGLLPVESLPLEPGTTPLYLTFSVPYGTAPGRYHGTLRFRDGSGKAVLTLPVCFDVWNYTLPRRPLFDVNSDMKAIPPWALKLMNCKGSEAAEKIRMFQLKYHVTPTAEEMCRDLLKNDFSTFRKAFDRYREAGASVFILGLAPNLLKKYPEEQIRKADEYLKREGLTDYFIVRLGMDELSYDRVFELIDRCKAWRKLSSIPVMETYYHDQNALEAAQVLHIFCRGAGHAWMKEAQAKYGTRFWRVNAFSGVLENSPLIGRRTYWDFYRYGFSGTYLWTIKNWALTRDWGKDYWSDSGVGNLSAVLMWPHETGLLSTIRLENLRRGIEDYQIFLMLDRALAAHPEQTGAGRKLLEKVKSVTPLSTEAELDAIRLEAGKMLSNMTK